jgi:hypothetical protein
VPIIKDLSDLFEKK